MKLAINALKQAVEFLFGFSNSSSRSEPSIRRFQNQSQLLGQVLLVCSLSILAIGVVVRAEMTAVVALAVFLCLVPSLNLLVTKYQKGSRPTETIDRISWVSANLGVFILSVSLGQLSNIHFVLIGLIALRYRISPLRNFLKSSILPSILFLSALVISSRMHQAMAEAGHFESMALNSLASFLTYVMAMGGIVLSNLKVPFVLSPELQAQSKTPLELPENFEAFPPRIQSLLRRSEKLGSQDMLIAGIAHELRTPISSIRGIVEMMQYSGENSPGCVEAMAHVLECTRRLENLVGTMRRFSLPEAHLFPTVFSLSETTCRIVGMFGRQFVMHNIQYEFKKCDQDDRICAELTQIEGVIQNLVANSIDAYTSNSSDLHRARPRKISVGVRRHQNNIELWVEDRAGGMPKSVQDKLFRPFFTTKSQDHGTGLGLSLVKQTVDSLQGSISFESSEGAGTVFKVNLPAYRKIESSETAIAEAQVHQNSGRDFSKSNGGVEENAFQGEISEGNSGQLVQNSKSSRRRVLIIDDDVPCAQVMQKFLDSSTQAEIVHSARIGLEKLATENFDVVIADWNLPDMAGADLVRNVRSLSPDSQVLVVSGAVDALQQSKIGAQTPNLRKPFACKAKFVEWFEQNTSFTSGQKLLSRDDAN